MPSSPRRVRRGPPVTARVFTFAIIVAGCGGRPASQPPAVPPTEHDGVDVAIGSADGGRHPGGHGAGVDAGPIAGPPSMLTYWDDIAPLLANKCVNCHRADGIAPFRLDRFADAKMHAFAAAQATRAGIMPPYLMGHDGSCGQFDDAEALTEDEKTKIWAWAAGGQNEGTARDVPVPAPVTLGPARVYKTPLLVPVAQGGAYAAFDEYRCFTFDSALDHDAFITGYEVIPGTPALVHHVQGFLLDPSRVTAAGKTNAEVLAALEAADGERPGWPCLGDAGGGQLRIESIPLTWAPGQGVMQYPQGVGVRHLARYQMIIQIHYNLADPRVKGESDATTVRVRHAGSVVRRAIFQIGDPFLDSLESSTPSSLPPGQASVTVSWTRTLAQLNLRKTVPYVDLIGIMPHMHERGVRQELQIGPPGAPKTCAARLDRWDFHWQKFYSYRQPYRRVDATTEITMRCEYDTSRDAQPILPGWGTRNEMCTAILMFAVPPGT